MRSTPKADDGLACRGQSSAPRARMDSRGVTLVTDSATPSSETGSSITKLRRDSHEDDVGRERRFSSAGSDSSPGTSGTPPTVKVATHWHPVKVTVTVISGTLNIQEHGIGPLSVHYLNRGHDGRQ